MENLIFFFCGGLFTYLLLYIRFLWDNRRQPIRRDSPTGNEPWIPPEPRVRSKFD